jgi:hypothetical protein
MTTLGKGVDIYGVGTPGELGAYVQANGIEVVGGYAWDDDVLGANQWTAEHYAAVEQYGAVALPIITLRTGTYATGAQLVAALQAQGRHGGPVGWDREDSSALPSQAVMTALVGAVRAAGYGPMVGYRWPFANLEAWYSDLMDSIWAAIPGGSSLPPDGAEHVQYGQVDGYDLDTFDLDVLTGHAAEGDLAVPILALGDDTKNDPHGQGAVYLVSNWPYGPKRWVKTENDLAPYTALGLKVQTVNQYVLDRCEEEQPIASGLYVTEP